MATSTTTYVNGTYKTTDENGRVTYSDSPPNTPPNTEQCEADTGGGNAASVVDAPFKSNKCLGVIYAIDKKIGKPVQIPTINGKIDPAFTEKQRKEIQESAYKKFQERVAAEAKAKEASDLAETERLKISNNYGISAEAGCEPEFPGAPEKKLEVGIGKPGSKDPGNVTVFNPGFKIPFTPGAAGCKISLKVEANAPNLYEKATGDAKNAQTARDVSEKAKEMQGEYDAAYAKARTDLAKPGSSLQAVNDQLAKDLADLGRKWGKEAGAAALK